MTRTNQQWRLAERPVGMIEDSNFTWHEEPVAELGDGQILMRPVYLSLDPTNRIWMSDMPQYMTPVQVGEVMRGMGVGVVEESRHPNFVPGDWVSDICGWQRYAVLGGDTASKLPPMGVPLIAYATVLNHIGATAYFGLTDIAAIKAGDTVVVSAAAGAVGSLAGQLAKLKGCRVIGITGTDAKCKWIVDELGFDGAINYKTEDVGARLDDLCPDGVDVDFENVGGAIMDEVLAHMSMYGRMALCGTISNYTTTKPVPGPYHFAQILMKRLRVQGFIILDYIPRYEEAFAKLAPLLLEGKLKYAYDLVDGLDNAPGALNRLFTGANTGKLLVKVSGEPA
jgi:hypothetical protein